MSPAPASPPTDDVRRALRRITRAVDVHSRRLARSYGLTGPQLAVLRLLAEQGEVTAGALARAACLSQPTVTGILDRLERRALVARRRSGDDRRRVLVRLSEHGREVALGAPPLLAETFVRGFEALPDWEQTQLLSALQRIASLMEPVREPLAVAS